MLKQHRSGRRAPDLYKDVVKLGLKLVVLGGALMHPALASTADKCADLLHSLNLPDTTISSSELDRGGSVDKTFPDAGPKPESCVVKGEIGAYTSPYPDPQTGSDQYGIHFELRLPTSWNGRFFYQGGGGADGGVFEADGVIPSQVGSLPALMGAGSSPETPALWRGFAVVSSDSGHQGSKLTILSPILSGFGVDPTARINYGYASIGAVTPVAKSIIETYYGKPPHHSYFLGCSKGGQEAMQASQRYGDLFDGIVAGDPAFRVAHASVAMAWNTQVLATAATAQAPGAVDSNGNPLLYKAISEPDLDLLRKGVLKACDALDGLKDGIVSNWSACIGRFDPQSLQCSGNKTSGCLSAAQVEAVRKIFAGAVDDQGNPIYSSFPYDTGMGSLFGWRAWYLGFQIGSNLSLNSSLVQGSSRYVMTTPPDPTLSQFTADISAMEQSIYATSGDYTVPSVDFMEATSTNLDTLKDRGGKLIIYHGASDAVFSMFDTMNYFNNLTSAYGSQTQDFARLYVVPGMNHCAGGNYAVDTFDTLDTIVNWVEHGKQPQSLTATHGSSLSLLPKGISRPLCPYPQYARYSGHGDKNSASSFKCVAS